MCVALFSNLNFPFRSNRRLDNNFNIFEGLTKNYLFIGISIIMCGGQVLIIMVGGRAFNISPLKQTPAMWAYAIVLGFLSIPVGVIIRLIPDRLIEKLIPDYLKRRANSKVPGLTVSDDEERYAYLSPLAEVRDQLTFLKRVKGGRVNNLKFAMRHPRETFMPKYKSPSHSREHSRANSVSMRIPQTPTRGDSFGSASNVPTPDSRKRSRSNRSRSNSALGAVTVMTGIVAGSIAAGWSPIDRRGEPDFGQFPPKPSATSGQESESDSSKQTPMATVLGEESLTDEPQEVSEGFSTDDRSVPMLSIPKPPTDKRADA